MNYRTNNSLWLWVAMTSLDSQKLNQHIHVAEVLKEVVLKERYGAEWEGVIEECKR